MDAALLKQGALLLGVAGVSFVVGDMYGVQSVPKIEKRWELTVESCHRFLEAGWIADFGKCVAAGDNDSGL